MSTSPTLSAQAKSFWSRPEGKVGMVFLAIAGTAIGLSAWSILLPKLIAIVENTLYLGVTAAALVAFLMVVTNRKVHQLIGLVFKIVMRSLTGLVIQLDPIAIIKDRLAQMRRKREELDGHISKVEGQIRMLKNQIEKNEHQHDTAIATAVEAKKRAGETDDELQKQRMALQLQQNANKAGRLEKSTMSYKKLLEKLVFLQKLLQRWANHLDFFIADQDDAVRQQEIEYKTVNAAYSAMNAAREILKGDADSNEIYNDTLDHLAENFGTKLGEIEDFSRLAENFIETVDLQNGAVGTKVLQQLEAYEQKLLVATASGNELLPNGASPTKTPVPVGRTSAAHSSGDYSDVIK
jgi:hypothetical protein